MMQNRVFLSALGIVCSLGSSKKDVLQNLLTGSLKNMIECDDFALGKKVKLGCVTDEFPEIPTYLKAYQTRCNQLLLASYLQIKNEVNLAIKKYGRKRIAVIIGSSTSGVDEVQKEITEEKTLSEIDFNLLEMGNPAKFLSDFLELEGIFYTVSTACSSGAKAFASAQNLINLDLCDAVLVGGSDSLCKLTIRGFDALESISQTNSNPFGSKRDGINIGEGAALFLMTKENISDAVELLAVGESSDAYHAASPDPQGTGAIAAISEALKKSGLKAHEIDYINLHGTGTRLNDSMESLAVNNLFGDQTYCSSTKPLTGHTLGSSGIIEVAFCWLILQNDNSKKALPPHIFDGEYDTTLPKLRLVKISETANKLTTCLSNSFAFGGSNASVIIRKNV